MKEEILNKQRVNILLYDFLEKHKSILYNTRKTRYSSGRDCNNEEMFYGIIIHKDVPPPNVINEGIITFHEDEIDDLYSIDYNLTKTVNNDFIYLYKIKK